MTAQALTEDEINDINCFYYLLNQCSKIQNDLIKFKKIEEEYDSSQNYLDMNDPERVFMFNSNAKWNSFKDYSLMAIEKGDSLVERLQK